MSYRLLVTMAVMFMLPATLYAHGLGVEAKLKGDKVAVEVFFDDDTPAAEAKLVVTSEAGTAIAEGYTDAKGLWSFPAPPVGKYKVTVDAGGGHLAKISINIPSRMLQPVSTPEQFAQPALESLPDMIVSSGPSRSAMTGWWRWLMSGLGVVVIVLLTLVFRVLTRKVPHQPTSTTKD